MIFKTYFTKANISKGILAVLLGMAMGLSIMFFFGQETFDLRQAVRECNAREVEYRLICFDQMIRRAVQNLGVEGTILAVGAEGIRSELSRPHYCHYLGHRIGREAYGYYGGDIERARSAVEGSGTQLCAGAYEHGLLEAYFLHSSVSFPEKMEKGCAAYRAREMSDQVAYGCFHGIGHALMAFHGNHIALSLTQCKMFPQDWQRHACAFGVFMEYGYAFHPGYTGSRFPITASLRELCGVLSDFWKPECYFFVGFGTPGNAEQDFRGGFALCDSVEDGFLQGCYKGMGVLIGGQVDSLNRIKEICVNAAAPYRSLCLLESGIVFLRYHDQISDSHNILCQFFGEKDEQKECEKRISNDQWLYSSH